MSRAPRINTYDQRRTPGGPAQPSLRDPGGASEVLSGVAQGLGAVSDGLARRQSAELEIERLRLAREEDDARVYTARALADFSAAADQARRETFDAAPDGWRGVTTTLEGRLNKISETAIAAAPTPSANRFLSEALYAARGRVLAQASDEEYAARGAWQVDTGRAAIDTWAGVIAADPSQYDAAIAQTEETLGGISDANARRDLTTLAQGAYAASAVQGMIERDPSATLRALRDPNAGGAVAALGADRSRFINAAENEIERRAARWRASVRDRLASTYDAWELGGDAANAPSVETVRAALGSDAASEYEARRLAFSAVSEFQSMPNAELNRIATAVPGNDASLEERRALRARAGAAASVLAQRDNPVAYATRRGLLDDGQTMADAINGGDVSAIGALVRSRSAVLSEQAASLGDGRERARAPLTETEAQGLRRMLNDLSPDARASALQTLRGPTPARTGPAARDNAYQALIAQIYPPESAAAEFGGATLLTRRPQAVVRSGERAITGTEAGRLMLEGARLLNPTPGPGDGEARAAPLVNMPGGGALEAAFDDYVGDALRDDPIAYQRAFQGFRAYMAGAASERGVNVNSLRVNGGLLTGDASATALAREAAAAAVGELRPNRHGGVNNPDTDLPSRTVMPWGMSQDRFNASVRAGWAGIRARYPQAELSDSPNDYDYQALGDGAYRLYRDGVPVASGEGGYADFYLPSAR